MLPIVAVLLWLYWYLLPREADGQRRWRLADSLLLIILVVLATLFVQSEPGAGLHRSNPMWIELVAAAGAYGIFAIGLALGLWWRRSRSP